MNFMIPRSVLRQLLQVPVIVAALGYFVGIYDLLLFSIVRVDSLKSLAVQNPIYWVMGFS